MAKIDFCFELWGNAIERMIALSDGGVIDESLIPDDGPNTGEKQLTLKERIAAVERGFIVKELERSRGNQSETARQLGVSRVTLIDKMKKYGLR